MKRKCPNCQEKTISIFRLLLWNTRCGNCRVLVGTHWLLGISFYFVAFLVCLFSTIVLLNKFGFAFTVPIILIWVGAEILREAIVPLETKESRII